jgi:RNA polymerase sigma-70 factor (ECF subfamily)
MDREIVLRARSGDRDAFAALVRASLGRLNAVARLIVHDPDRAEDAVQDALIDAWRDLRALRDPDRFDAWLHRLLVRACYEHAGKDRRRRVREITVAVDIDVATADTQSSLARTDELARAIRMLPTEQRAVLALVYYLDLPQADAAEVLDIPVGTVKSRLHRAIGSLRVELEADARRSGATRESLA